MKRNRRLLHHWINFRSTVAAWFLDVASRSLKLVPPLAAVRIVTVLGWLFGRLPTRDKSSMIQNIKTLLHFSEPEANQLVKTIIVNFGLTLLDFFIPEGIQVDVPDRAKLEALHEKYGGFLVLTFHMGNWELGARVMASWGWPVTAVYQPYQNKKFRKVIDRIRAPGVQFIPVGRSAATGVRQALKRGDIVAMLGDHIFGEAGLEVKVLNHPMRWPRGPLVLAIKENVPIVVAVVLRTGPRRYRAFIDEPLLPQGKNRSMVEKRVQEVADKFGRFLQDHPEQWYRFKPLQTMHASLQNESLSSSIVEKGAPIGEQKA